MPKNSVNDVIVRFSPSNTGYLHLGGARTALYNWLFAKKYHGTFILRIEDTDYERSSEEMIDGILQGLEWLGLTPDLGPFFQSKNKDRHVAAVDYLVKAGLAYYDFTPKEERSDKGIKERISEKAKIAHDNRSNPYRDLLLREARKKVEDGEHYCIRLKVPRDIHGQNYIEFEDIVFGKQHRALSDIEDLVLLRNDGTPLYNLAVVCDDIEMKITHVIRGQDHLTNTFKQILIYWALCAKLPKFAHLPLINAPGKKKLSKRIHGEIVSVTTYRDKGFLPEALINYLALLGWTPKNEKEIMSIEEIIEEFDLSRIHKNPAIFNFNENDKKNWTDPKALWMNHEHIQRASSEQLAPLVKRVLPEIPWIDKNKDKFKETIDLVKSRYSTLLDFKEKGLAYFVNDYPLNEESKSKHLSNWKIVQSFPLVASELRSGKNPEEAIRQTASYFQIKDSDLMSSLRVALTGQSVGARIDEIILLLGRDESSERILNIYNSILLP